MNVWTKIGLGAIALVGGGVVAGCLFQRGAMADAEAAYMRFSTRVPPPNDRFDPVQVAHLPEIARRYFRHAIAPGTPLYSVVELEMSGTFLLGDRESFQTYGMTARQALRAPDQFVWLPKLTSGATSIVGSDALVGGEAWTRFWLFGMVPVAQERTTPDLVRSAQFRAAVESAMWLPASLLPEKGVLWEQVGSDSATATFTNFSPGIVLHLSLDSIGAVKEVVGQRWSNANPQKVFKLQPFGGTISAEGTFQGYTIPTVVSVGNHFRTEDYLPFFQATINRASYK